MGHHRTTYHTDADAFCLRFRSSSDHVLTPLVHMLCCALVDNHGCCALVHMLLRIGSSAVAHWFTCCCALVGHMLLRSGEALFQVITLRLGVDCDGFNVPRLPRARGMLADYAQQGGNRERVRGWAQKLEGTPMKKSVTGRGLEGWLAASGGGTSRNNNNNYLHPLIYI